MPEEREVDVFMQYYKKGNDEVRQELDTRTATIIFNELGYGKEIRIDNKAIIVFSQIEIASFFYIKK